MKSILIALALFCYSAAPAQITLIPDNNFEQLLINQGIDKDGLVNGQVLTSNINTITTLNVSGIALPNSQKITSLQGIEGFTALHSLNCDNNFLTTLNLSGNSNLQVLYCDNNNLAALIFTNNTQLISIHCHDNQLTALDVTMLPGLSELVCTGNNLPETLDLSQNAALTTMNAQSNQNLVIIYVADAASANASTGIYANWLKDAFVMYSQH